MFWYKSWLETRWRFGIGLALLMVLAVGVVFDYPAVQKLMPLARNADLDAGGTLSGLIRQAAETQRDYRGYVWWQWYRQNLTQTWTVFAVYVMAVAPMVRFPFLCSCRGAASDSA